LVEKKKKEQLKRIYENLNPADLKLEITRLQNELLNSAALFSTAPPNAQGKLRAGVLATLAPTYVRGRPKNST